MALEPVAGHARRISRLGIAAALIALSAAVLSAVVPAHHQQSTITWPASSTDQPSGTVGAPLLLARHHPEAISVSIPCGAAILDGTAMKTAVDPVGTGGLNISFIDGVLTMAVGASLLGSVNVDSAAESTEGSCTIIVMFRNGAWSFGRSEGRLQVVEGPPPVVSGLFADAAFVNKQSAMVSALIIGYTSGSSPSALQWVLIALSLTTGLVAISATCRWPSRRVFGATLRRSLGALDLLVVAAIGAWAIVGPTFFDDGWVMQTVSQREPGGQFRSYNETWDATLPLAFLHDAAYWLTVRGTDFLIYWRLVTVVVLIAAWLVLRIGLNSVVPKTSRLVWATGGAVFVLNVAAWLMTLRPEPMVAAASAVTISSALAFERSTKTQWLMIGGVVAAISTSLHPSGVLAATPMIALLPCVYRNVQSRRIGKVDVVAVAAVSCSALVLCVFADSDLGRWIENRDVFEAAGVHTLTWRDELSRYVWLFVGVYDTVLRRATVLVALAVVLLATARRVRKTRSTTMIPLAALTLAIGLLAATPSKWPWHFGSLAILATAAFAVEMQDEASDANGYRTWSACLTVLGVVFVSTIAWRGQEIWGALISGTGRTTFLDAAQLLRSPVTPIIVFALLALVFRLRGRQNLDAWHQAAMALPLAAILIMISATYGRFAAPAFVDDSSLARTNVAALLGRPTCGLSDAVRIDDPTAATPALHAGLDSTTWFQTDVPALTNGGTSPVPTDDRYWADDALSTFVAGNDDIGWVATDWQVLPVGEHGLFAGVAGRVGGGNQIALQRGTSSAGVIENISTEFPDITHDADAWKRVQLARVTAAEGDVARLVLVDRTAGFRGWISATVLWTAPTRPLRSITEGRVVRVDPAFRSLLPCIDEPPLDNGLAVAPDLILGSTPFNETSSQRFTSDLRDLTDVLATSSGSPVVSATVLEQKPDWSYLPWRFGR